MAQHESPPVSCTFLSSIPELVDTDDRSSFRLTHTGRQSEMEELKRAIEQAWPNHFALETRQSTEDSGLWELSLKHL